MRFAVSLLTVLGVASIIGTVLKQNEPYANYIIQFGQFWFELFNLLGLYDVYHALWFLLILLFLVISTSLCIYRNSPQMLRDLRNYRENATSVSLRSFSHQASYTTTASAEALRAQLLQFLTLRGFRYRIQPRDGGELIAAKAGSYQRLGYIFTHAAIVVICVGGLMDGNLPFKVQEMLGHKKIETLDVPASQVPPESRMGVGNLSFRANMTLPEGSSADVAFLRVKDGYLVQELPFRIALKDFRIEHYATGQPKSFESDLVITDPDLKEPLTRTISVNKPLIYKGIAIYQSDFQDGGTGLDFDMWDILGAGNRSLPLKGTIFDEVKLGDAEDNLTIEFNDFRLFNILNLSADGKGKSHNVGANVTFKVRDTQGQAREYVNYMQPLRLNGRAYFVSGMRNTQREEFKYLRLPVDEDMSLQSFMRLRSVMFDQAQHAEIAARLSRVAMPGDASDADLKAKFESSIQQLLLAFSRGGYTKIAEAIEQAVPEAERDNAAQTYLKIVNGAAFEAYNLSRERAGLPAAAGDEETQLFLQDAMNAMSDLFFYGSPFYLQLQQFQQREASGLQLTRSPGKALVYTGSLLLVLGIFAMIYIRERRIWLLVKANEATGEQQLLFTMSSNRKNRDLDLEFAQYQQQLQQQLTS
ncbi:cytochrome c biogenesis protein ResB [Pseudomethylobacillus aquaticus]|uniref:Cytochrome c biogenesis protein ResB n=1 Tax=Pseudomethylobacillus aquaticus TaxID=2676064 RepID=A0A3N0UZ97_9PROT|nr:cytochrome c biogenesis protein ResB [Pseudomethylobacillus aquaticus]ROH85867.1 cytochrome c biogenesis protein ResB [Pseudomethylobacillus aquaticus]